MVAFNPKLKKRQLQERQAAARAAKLRAAQLAKRAKPKRTVKLQAGLDPENPLMLQKAIEGQARVGIRSSSSASGWLVPPEFMKSQLGTFRTPESRALVCAPQVGPAPAGTVTRSLCSKQSGVVGVWHHPEGQWVARWFEGKKAKHKYFRISNYEKDGKSREYAEAKALKEAIKYRQQHVSSGQARVTNQWGRRSERVSGIQGVTWHKTQQIWCVRIGVHGKTIRGGRFVPANGTEAGIEQARQHAVAARTALEVKHYRITKNMVAPIEPAAPAELAAVAAMGGA